MVVMFMVVVTSRVDGGLLTVDPSPRWPEGIEWELDAAEVLRRPEGGAGVKSSFSATREIEMARDAEDRQ
jgi:hypothetical protein